MVNVTSHAAVTSASMLIMISRKSRGGHESVTSPRRQRSPGPPDYKTSALNHSATPAASSKRQKFELLSQFRFKGEIP